MQECDEWTIAALLWALLTWFLPSPWWWLALIPWAVCTWKIFTTS